MWTSLEVVKLIISALTPIAVLGLGWLVSRSTRRIEDRQWVDRKVIERRVVLYDVMAPALNEILCFFCTVGNFREITPPVLVAGKRSLDRHFHLGKYLMSSEWRTAYETLIKSCFETYKAAGTDATIRASVDLQRLERGGTWIEGWVACFVTNEREVTPPKEIARRYEELLVLFARDLGVPQQDERKLVPTTRPRRLSLNTSTSGT